MSTFYIHFIECQKKFREDHPFTSFYADKDQRSGEHISNSINQIIISKLRDIIQNQVALDVALIDIYALFCYATRDLHALFPDFVQRTFIGYYKFLFHFILFGCCLGPKYVKYIALCRMKDYDYSNNEVLRYCIDAFVPNMTELNMKYKYCNSRRMQIINSLRMNPNYRLHDDIIRLIADFTAFPFAQFLVEVAALTPLWDVSNPVIDRQLYDFGYSYDTQHTINPLILTKLLLNSDFMVCPSNDVDITYFANAIQFEIISQLHNDIEYHACYITQLYEIQHLTITPWTDAKAFIELFELLHVKHGHCIMNLFDKCIDIGPRRDNIDEWKPPLSIIYNGQMNRCERIGKREMELIYTNIDILVEEFLIPYCLSSARIMNNVMFQINNALIYLWGTRIDGSCSHLHGLTQMLINKLESVMGTHILEHTDGSQFIRTVKYKQSLANMMEIKLAAKNQLNSKSFMVKHDEQTL
eukprot:184916_1